MLNWNEPWSSRWSPQKVSMRSCQPGCQSTRWMAPHAEKISRESVGEMTGALPMRRVTDGKVPVGARWTHTLWGCRRKETGQSYGFSGLRLKQSADRFGADVVRGA